MIKEYKNKGPRKRFHKHLTLNMKEKMYQDLLKVAEKDDETMSDVARTAIKKEIERRTS